MWTPNTYARSSGVLAGQGRQLASVLEQPKHALVCLGKKQLFKTLNIVHLFSPKQLSNNPKHTPKIFGICIFFPTPKEKKKKSAIFCVIVFPWNVSRVNQIIFTLTNNLHKSLTFLSQLLQKEAPYMMWWCFILNRAKWQLWGIG